MMYRIFSKAGVDFGAWEGDSPEEALRAMVNEAVDGCADDGTSLAGTVEDWDFVPEDA